MHPERAPVAPLSRSKNHLVLCEPLGFKSSEPSPIITCRLENLLAYGALQQVSVAVNITLYLE